MSLLALLLFVSIGFEILNPQLLGHFIDSIQSSMKVLRTLLRTYLPIVPAKDRSIHGGDRRGRVHCTLTSSTWVNKNGRRLPDIESRESVSR